MSTHPYTDEIIDRLTAASEHPITDDGADLAVLVQAMDADLAKYIELADAATNYKAAADEATAVQIANGRRGASAAAVDQVNRYRERARIAHNGLVEAIGNLAR